VTHQLPLIDLGALLLTLFNLQGTVHVIAENSDLLKLPLPTTQCAAPEFSSQYYCARFADGINFPDFYFTTVRILLSRDFSVYYTISCYFLYFPIGVILV